MTTAAELKRVRFSYIASILEETYHALRCEWAAEINDINVRTFLTPKHAREHGYKPCTACDPDLWHGSILRMLRIASNDYDAMVQHNTGSPLSTWKIVASPGKQVDVLDGDGEAYSFVLVTTTDPNDPRPQFSIQSPLGRAVMGSRLGESRSVNAPGGVYQVRVVKIS